MKNILLAICILSSFNYFSQEEKLCQSKYLFYALRTYHEDLTRDIVNSGALRAESYVNFIKRLKEYSNEIKPGGFGFDEYYEGQYYKVNSLQYCVYKIFMWKDYILSTSTDFQNFKKNLQSSDTLANGKKMIEQIDLGLSESEQLIKLISQYETEFIPLVENYISKPNKKNTEILCNWYSSQKLQIFDVWPQIIKNRSPERYLDEEWSLLPESFRNFENFLRANRVEIYNLIEERLILQKRLSEWKEPTLYTNDKTILIRSADACAKKITEQLNHIDLLCTGEFRPSYKRTLNNDYFAYIVGKWWNCTPNNITDDAYCVLNNEFNNQLFKTTVLRFKENKGTITQNFAAKANYDKKDMNINKTIEFKVVNDTLFELRNSKWERLYWSDNKTISKSIIQGLEVNYYRILKKDSEVSIAVATGDKTKALVLCYIYYDFQEKGKALEILKLGDEVLYNEQSNRRLEKESKTCSYCGSDFTGKVHLATYDKKKYQCDEREVSDYKNYSKIFCTAKCALEYCRKTQY